MVMEMHLEESYNMVWFGKIEIRSSFRKIALFGCLVYGKVRLTMVA